MYNNDMQFKNKKIITWLTNRPLESMKKQREDLFERLKQTSPYSGKDDEIKK